MLGGVAAVFGDPAAVFGDPVGVTPYEDPLDRLVDGTPLVLVRLVAAQKIEPPAAFGDRALDIAGHHQDARREVACVRIDTGVVVEVAFGRPEVDAGRDPSSTDRQEGEPDRAIRSVLLEEPSDKAARGV